MTTIIYELHNPTDIDLDRLPPERIAWIYDIDETLLRHDRGREPQLMVEGLADWFNHLLQFRHEDAVCFLTARVDPATTYPYDRKPEKELLHKLGLTNVKNTEQLTLNNNVPLFTYTAGHLKGRAFYNIVSQYQKLGYHNFYFLDDRLTQLESALNSCCDSSSASNSGYRSRRASDTVSSGDGGSRLSTVVSTIRTRRLSNDFENSSTPAVAGVSCNNGFNCHGRRSTITCFWISSMSNEKHLTHKYKIRTWLNRGDFTKFAATTATTAASAVDSGKSNNNKENQLTMTKAVITLSRPMTSNPIIKTSNGNIVKIIKIPGHRLHRRISISISDDGNASDQRDQHNQISGCKTCSHNTGFSDSVLNKVYK